MYEVVVQVRLWVAAEHEEEAGELVEGELSSHLDPSFAPDWLDHAIVEVRSVKRFEQCRIPPADLTGRPG
jgi:hypothetical protein